MSALSEEGTMKLSTGPRTTAKLSKSVSHQLNSYALAASAAGVSLLALAPLAEGRIVYTKTDHVIDNRHELYRLDLNHDKIVDFSIQLLHYEPIYGAKISRYAPRAGERGKCGGYGLL